MHRSTRPAGPSPSSACGKRSAPDLMGIPRTTLVKSFVFLRNEYSFQYQELSMSNSKIVFITGATAGIGRTTALYLAQLGHHVIASGRKAGELTKLQTEALGRRGKLDVVTLDVTSGGSSAAAV